MNYELKKTYLYKSTLKIRNNLSSIKDTKSNFRSSDR